MPPAAATPRRRLSAHDYRLDLRQQPVRCRATGSSDRALADRKAVDPPPIVQLVVRDGDPAREWLQSPFFFMCANLCDPVRDQPVPRPPSETLAGTLVSSLHRVRDEDDREGGYFVFGDISVKLEGRFRLQFSLFEMLDSQVEFITSIMTDVFTVYSAKQFPGVLESTALSRQFSDQGVRLRLRKETGARAAAAAAAAVAANAAVSRHASVDGTDDRSTRSTRASSPDEASIEAEPRSKHPRLSAPATLSSPPLPPPPPSAASSIAQQQQQSPKLSKSRNSSLARSSTSSASSHATFSSRITPKEDSGYASSEAITQQQYAIQQQQQYVPETRSAFSAPGYDDYNRFQTYRSQSYFQLPLYSQTSQFAQPPPQLPASLSQQQQQQQPQQPQQPQSQYSQQPQHSQLRQYTQPQHQHYIAPSAYSPSSPLPLLHPSLVPRAPPPNIPVSSQSIANAMREGDGRVRLPPVVGASMTHGSGADSIFQQSWQRIIQQQQQQQRERDTMLLTPPSVREPSSERRADSRER
ncbi:velvet factor-domain-containing protein [Kockiozyma suomiensis]|uniref:velvet factor-domain-containing protein n=1 Tax=Kockiozyma suomiensis TaxID=1337062 RepID=UPI003343EF76